MNVSFAYWIATCGPIGHVKVAPGSLTSLAAIPLIALTGNHSFQSIVLLVVVLCIAVWSSSVVAHDLRQHDPSIVVIDEVCGMMMSFVLIPINWWTLVSGFLGFRFFDVVKPPPIRLIERLPGGFGIVLDDVIAGIYTNLVLHILVHYAHL